MRGGRPGQFLEAEDLAISVQVLQEFYVQAGCDTVLSEDLGDGQDFNGVVVQDPLRSAPRTRTRRKR